MLNNCYFSKNNFKSVKYLLINFGNSKGKFGLLVFTVTIAESIVLKHLMKPRGGG